MGSRSSRYLCRCARLASRHHPNARNCRSNSMISASDTIVQDGSALFSPLDQELVMIDVASGKYLSIDAIGAAIWQAIAQPVGVDPLIDTLADRYGAPRDQVRDDVLAFLNNLASRGFVRIVAE
ncbi:PqqD family protein [Sphingomonas sp. HMWF008]|nr:PqqD family protein [Sphingomonas sp. HMWF008]